MDKALRNTLRLAVTRCRKLLEEAIAERLEGQYGLYRNGKRDEIASLGHLSDEERAFRAQLLAHLGHIEAGGFAPAAATDQLIREIAFTHLNRLCAFKLMEGRKLIREAVSRGANSNGFKFYLADHPEDEARWSGGQQDVAYRHFLTWQAEAFAGEIPALFARDDPANRLYPAQRVLDQVLEQLNAADLATVWDEDETIGWIYQYFTPKELRDQARKESAAPRNSYELAFRNQFYTPRYVVEFLVDNTLGRTWYEMRRGDTALTDRCRYLVRRPTEIFLAEGEARPTAQRVAAPAEDAAQAESLSREEALRAPVYVAHRAKRDPRDLRILDPACGSGHFLLYCFDLLETIYAEAWDDPDLGPALHETYPDAADFARQVPRLILAHNLHGIDIDPRATQIAALALWLRAQRAFQERGVRAKDRPAITRSHIVRAEPMPGERALFDEYVTSVDLRLRSLVREVWTRMEGAGEAGTLLRIEEDIKTGVRESREEALVPLPAVQLTLHQANQRPQQLPISIDVAKEIDFWDNAEPNLLAALRAYAETASDGAYQRRLFADDAARGFAFIDACRLRYDVVLMNPPFGAASKGAVKYLERAYPRTKNDLYAAFVERGLGLLRGRGLLGAITSRTGFFLTSFQKWREEILLKDARPMVVADLGQGVLDTAMVETAAYTLEKC